MRYGLKAVLAEQETFIARKRNEGDCCVLLTNVPAEGSLTHRAEEVLRAYKDQHSMEQNYGFLKDPLIVNRLFLKKPARIEAQGLLLLLALLVWRLMERQLRAHIETTSTSLTGWDQKAMECPTAFMMTTKCSLASWYSKSVRSTSLPGHSPPCNSSISWPWGWHPPILRSLPAKSGLGGPSDTSRDGTNVSCNGSPRSTRP
jgi:hypothetical protein